MAKERLQDQKIEFLAYLPPIQTALTVSGDGDLLRIKLDCNLSISPEAARLLMMTGKRLRVTIEELKDRQVRHEAEKEKHRRTRNTTRRKT